MSPVLELLIILAVIYAIDCFLWLPVGSAAIRTWLGGRVSPGWPSALLNNGRRGLVALSPLPFDLAARSSPLPVSISPRGVYAYTALTLDPSGRSPQSRLRLLFDAEMPPVRAVDDRVLAGDRELAAVGSPAVAQHTARLIRRVAAAPVDERGAIVERALRRSLDPERVRRRWGRFLSRARRLRAWCSALFTLLFVVIPVLDRTVGLYRWWIVLIPAYFWLLVVTVRLFCRLHARCYPRNRRERRSKGFLLSIAPTYAIRGADLVAHDIVATFHPLAVTRALAGEAAFRELARRAVRDARRPIAPVSPDDGPEAREIEAWFRELSAKLLDERVRAEGVDPPSLITPPPRLEDAAVAYCPRCEEQFGSLEDRCETCGDLELEPLA